MAPELGTVDLIEMKITAVVANFSFLIFLLHFHFRVEHFNGDRLEHVFQPEV